MSGNPDMTYDEVVMGRRSIRGYLDKPVPRAVIETAIAILCSDGRRDGYPVSQ